MLPNAVPLSPLFPCQSSSAPLEAALLSQSWAALDQHLSLAPGYIGGCQGQGKRAGGKSVTQTAVCWSPTLLLYDSENSFLQMTLTGLAFWLFKISGWNPETLLSVEVGFFASSPPQCRGSQSYLDPHNFWVSDAKEKVCVVVFSIFQFYIRIIVRYSWCGWAPISNGHMPKAPEQVCNTMPPS